jgi:hypothetical protein
MLGYGGGQAVLVRFHALQDILVADGFNSHWLFQKSLNCIHFQG